MDDMPTYSRICCHVTQELPAVILSISLHRDADIIFYARFMFDNECSVRLLHLDTSIDIDSNIQFIYNVILVGMLIYTANKFAPMCAKVATVTLADAPHKIQQLMSGSIVDCATPAGADITDVFHAHLFEYMLWMYANCIHADFNYDVV